MKYNKNKFYCFYFSNNKMQNIVLILDSKKDFKLIKKHFIYSGYDFIIKNSLELAKMCNNFKIEKFYCLNEFLRVNKKQKFIKFKNFKKTIDLNFYL